MSKPIALPDATRTAPVPRKATRLVRRFIALALAVGVPAFAAPAEWRSLAALEKAQAEPLAPMGFETAGESFPGSAFYYLADEPYLPAAVEAPSAAEEAAAFAGDTRAGPAAHALAIGGTTMDRSRALQCMTKAIYYEAASESDAGQRAVAQVVLNRVAHPAYPNTVCGVVFQGSQRSTGCQFSFTCDGSLARQPSRRFWERARTVANKAIAGAVYRPVGLATHYHTVQIHPYWADSLDHVGTIGAHRFYRWKGAAGQLAAFSATYAGGEPLPVPSTRAMATATEAADPIALARAFEERQPSEKPGLPAPRPAATAAATPAPAYAPEIVARGGDTQFSGSRLPGGGTVKQEYSASGQWIAQP